MNDLEQSSLNVKRIDDDEISLIDLFAVLLAAA
jgi:hypothetical protein